MSHWDDHYADYADGWSGSVSLRRPGFIILNNGDRRSTVSVECHAGTDDGARRACDALHAFMVARSGGVLPVKWERDWTDTSGMSLRATALPWLSLYVYPEHRGDTGRWLWSAVVCARGISDVWSARRDDKTFDDADSAKLAAATWLTAQVMGILGGAEDGR